MDTIFKGRHLINILLLSISFIVLFFAIILFLFIPAGKAYKQEHETYVHQKQILNEAQNRHDDTLHELKSLQTKYRTIIRGYEKAFDPQEFDEVYSRYFTKLTLKEIKKLENESIFEVYEVRTTSKINSPTIFYDFLTAINKSDNIIRVEFPIEFVAHDGVIDASFRMQVYGANFHNYKEQNSSITVQEEKEIKNESIDISQ